MPGQVWRDARAAPGQSVGWKSPFGWGQGLSSGPEFCLISGGLICACDFQTLQPVKMIYVILNKNLARKFAPVAWITPGSGPDLAAWGRVHVGPAGSSWQG